MLRVHRDFRLVFSAFCFVVSDFRFIYPSAFLSSLSFIKKKRTIFTLLFNRFQFRRKLYEGSLLNKPFNSGSLNDVKVRFLSSQNYPTNSFFGPDFWKHIIHLTWMVSLPDLKFLPLDLDCRCVGVIKYKPLVKSLKTGCDG